MNNFMIERNADGTLDLESVNAALINLAKINCANSDILYISVSDSGLTINGQTLTYGPGLFSESEISQILLVLVEKGATINPYDKNGVIFNDTKLFFGPEKEREPEITVDIESVIRAIRNLASVVAQKDHVLYISLTEDGWSVNGAGLQYRHKFTADDHSMIISKLKELGAVDNEYNPGHVIIKDTTAFWNYGPEIIPDHPDYSIEPPSNQNTESNSKKI